MNARVFHSLDIIKIEFLEQIPEKILVENKVYLNKIDIVEKEGISLFINSKSIHKNNSESFHFGNSESEHYDNSESYHFDNSKSFHWNNCISIHFNDSISTNYDDSKSSHY